MKKIRLVLVLVLSIVFLKNSALIAQEGTWTLKSAIPTARKEIANATVVLNRKIYVIGGIERSGTISNKVEVYDVDSDTWTEAAEYPIRIWRTSAAVADNKIYVFGGYLSTNAFPFSPTNRVFEYDISSNSWSEKSNMPTARGASTAVELNGIIHVLGGAANGALNIHQAYNPTNDTWESAQSMPTGRSGLTATVFNNKIFTMGGYFLSNGVVAQDLVEVYDPSNDTWTTVSNMPQRRNGIDAVTANEKIYVLGGKPDESTSRTLEYDITIDTWQELEDMPTPVSFMGTAVVDNIIYAIGGGPVNLNRFDAVDLTRAFTLSAVTSVGDRLLPEKFELKQNYPNPFNPSTKIEYHLFISGHITLKVFDALGKEIAVLVNDFKNKGSHSVNFSAVNSLNKKQSLTSGVYFYRISGAGFSITKKMLILK